jgi:hypothetical protein
MATPQRHAVGLVKARGRIPGRRLAVGGGVSECPPPSARVQSITAMAIYTSLSTCQWRWARNDSTVHGYRRHQLGRARVLDLVNEGAVDVAGVVGRA